MGSCTGSPEWRPAELDACMCSLLCPRKSFLDSLIHAQSVNFVHEGTCNMLTCFPPKSLRLTFNFSTFSTVGICSMQHRKRCKYFSKWTTQENLSCFWPADPTTIRRWRWWWCQVCFGLNGATTKLQFHCLSRKGCIPRHSALNDLKISPIGVVGNSCGSRKPLS